MSHISQTEIRRLDFTLLLVMRGLLRHRRTTTVAAELGLSQSAISYSLTRLREVFGDELFVRRPHGLEPTLHALELAPRIQAMLLQAEEAIGLSEVFDPALTTRAFRIAALDHVTAVLAPPLLRAFEAHAPGARFSFRTLRGEDALEALRREEIDLALGQFQRPLPGLASEPLFVDRYRLVARQGHPEVRGRVSKALFERLSHVAVSVEGDFRSLTDPALEDVGLSRRVAATAPTFPTAFAMAAGSDCVSVAPGRLASALAGPLGLQLCDLPKALPPIRVFTVRRLGRDVAVDWLAQQVRDCAEATAPA
jgi:DNA-binding transcriptional LysR family regulator